MIGPTPADQHDFMSKAGTIALLVASEMGVELTSRHLNLLCGASPKSKAEKAFCETALWRIWVKYPNDLYPRMCAPPPKRAKPALRVVQS